ncbi:MAG: putative glycerophosphodiester phosphodiesterase 1 [Syntrophus sp. SKADARSKE-3]|nr:putative glycerophosphodiester phosphodiesterase 1 [Syntrophus sp. SKADARSKE-3]
MTVSVNVNDDQPFLKIAHRGYSEKYPENTLLAFEQAILAGADMIELDIRFSQDGQIVVIHDSRINRTSDGRGRVADLTLAQLRRYNYINGMVQHGVIAIPTLEEVVDLFGRRVLLNVEIKKGRNVKRDIEGKLIELLTRKAMIDRVVISSFNCASLRRLKEINSDVKTGFLYKKVRRTFFDNVRSLGVSSLHPSLEAIDKDQLLWAKLHGIAVYTWVATDRATIEQCRSSGFIDGVIVNDLGLFR